MQTAVTNLFLRNLDVIDQEISRHGIGYTGSRLEMTCRGISGCAEFCVGMAPNLLSCPKIVVDECGDVVAQSDTVVGASILGINLGRIRQVKAR